MRPAPDVHASEPIPASAETEIRALLKSGDLFRYTAAADSAVSRLEKEFADFMGVPFALAVNSCSSALFLALKALGLKPGDRVLMPAFTFAAVPSAVVHADCQPVLVNVSDDYRMDIGDFKTKLTNEISAVLISHMRGHTSDMDAILQLCDFHKIPIIEDAAHSLGTTWSGQKIGTLGKIGCFSFQSYKLINAGEGGMLVTHDPDVIAQAIIMSGAYEHNWRKHPVVSDRFGFWQNKLPLYNVRMSNLSAAAARPQIREVPRRAGDGRANHDYVAAILDASGCFKVPAALPNEVRAPDSIQFSLIGFSEDDEAREFQDRAREKGVEVQIFGLSDDNARAFWNWEFITRQDDLSPTRSLLMRACDVRLPARLKRNELDLIAAALLAAASEVRFEALKSRGFGGVRRPVASSG